MSDTSTTKAKQATHEAEIDNSNRSTTPQSDKFLDYIMSGWAPSDDTLPAVRESAAYAAGRRTRLGAQFVGKRLVIAAGAMKQRSNDTFYQYRAHSAFSHLTGWGSDSEPGAVLVMDPIAADEGRGSPRPTRPPSIFASAQVATARSSSRTPRSVSSGSARARHSSRSQQTSACAPRISTSSRRAMQT